MRLDLAMKAFFRRVKAGEEPGYPRFKGSGRYESFTYPQSGFSLIGSPIGSPNQSDRSAHDGRVTLSEIGAVKMVSHRPIKGTIKTATVHRSSTGKWYVTFACETEPERLEPTSTQIGIDIGVKTFATLSTTEEIENPRFFRKQEKALAKAQRRLSKAEKGTFRSDGLTEGSGMSGVGSRNTEPAERKARRKVVARVHERVKFQRENFTHQQSRSIVDRYGVICVEDLHVNRLTHNHCLAKSIHDAAWSEFFSKLSCKAEEAGRSYVAVNPAYMSQDCSRCGHRQLMPLAERIYHCPCCLLSMDRDLNASRNILRRGLASLGIQSGEAPAFTHGE